MESFDYDVLVVGSGFGGSVTALRATEKGYRVAVVEAGRRFDKATGTTRITVRASMDGAKRTVLAALARAFPGAVVDGPKGLFVLPKEGE